MPFEPICRSDFEDRIGKEAAHLRSWDEARVIVSLRDLAKIVAIQDMPTEYLHRIVRNIPLLSGNGAKPYESCEIEVAKVDPRVVWIGQTFIHRPKYTALAENFPNVFSGFSINPGFGEIGPKIVLGQTREGKWAIANYLPPITEAHKQGLYLLDGIHRNFLMRSAGKTVESIILRKVEMPCPFVPRRWPDIVIVDEKPPREERYWSLRPELFRDLKFMGVDG